MREVLRVTQLFHDGQSILRRSEYPLSQVHLDIVEQRRVMVVTKSTVSEVAARELLLSVR
jgi:hypothetical protein